MIWRLIYNDTKIIHLFETNGTTVTPHQIFENVDQEVCFKKIDELMFTYRFPLNRKEILLFSGGTRTIISKEKI
jgi:hypothetical protein